MSVIHWASAFAQVRLMELRHRLASTHDAQDLKSE